MSSRTGKKKWNYLRARGEYFTAKPSRVKRTELPPRTRRIRWLNGTRGGVFGTTSAHAENTLAAQANVSQPIGLSHRCKEYDGLHESAPRPGVVKHAKNPSSHAL